MENNERAVRLRHIKCAIEERAFVRATDAPIVRQSGESKESGWLFDLRRILLEPGVLEDAAALFWERFCGLRELQIGCLESGGIPLATALVLLAKSYGGPEKPFGFFIRKSRKKSGLMKIVEGNLSPSREMPIVLVDDLVNSGKSFIRQVEVLTELGYRVHAIWCLIRFRDAEYYTYFKERNIEVHALFELNDFHDSLGIQNLTNTAPPIARDMGMRACWKFSSPHPSYQYVVPKSDIALDGTRLYTGSDSGIFWAINQADGSVAWSYEVGFHPKGKGIFSSPALCAGTVYFGAYDGNVYALDAKTGKKKWIYFDADWIGSSPALAPDLGLLFIGLEFGLIRKRGGIVALDIETGKQRWKYTMPCFTHSSPLFLPSTAEVMVGSNDGCAYLFDAHKGVLKWRFETGKITEEELSSGFSEYDIKASFAHDATRDVIVFGNRRGVVYFVDRSTGALRGSFVAQFGFYSTPVVHHDTVLVASLDKHLYCIDLDTMREKWRWYAGARIFATPVVIKETIYVGANTGRLTALDSSTGKERSFITFPERITNKITFNPLTSRVFVPTFANEIYCLERADAVQAT